MPSELNLSTVKFVAVATTTLGLAVLSLTGALASGQDPDEAARQSTLIQVYSSTDDGALPIDTMAAGENAAPIAETQSAGGVKWYLVKTRNEIVGWIKRNESDQAKKVENFFRSLPQEAAATAVTIPSISLRTAPHGAVVVPVLSSGRSMIVSVTLNRAHKANLVLDTGATNTVISRRLAHSMALRPVSNAVIQTVGGRIGVAVTRLQSMRVGEAEITEFSVIVHDFSSDPRYEGLLGMDFLGRYKLGLDIQQRVLVLWPR